ncbi:MAG: hypothetical protein K8R86_07145 [Bacteroidales bacterium]|nr:hypothetical protein [Bacteroidales bacterium]
MKKYVLFLILTIGYTCQLLAYDMKDSVFSDYKLALKIFLDCESCDMDYFRENFTIVNYVREPLLSDVQIQVTTQTTGSGGVKYNFIFLGRKRYKSLNDTLVFSLSPDHTPDESRKVMLEKLQIGLVPYIMKTAYADRIVLVVDNVKGDPEIKKDPWKNWMFDVFGSGSLFSERYTKSYNLFSNLYISKITSKIKIESQNTLAYAESHINNYPVNDTTYYSSHLYQRSFLSRSLFVKSLGDHFGIGGIAVFRTDHQYNIDFQVKAGPAIEYNVFKYKDASQKQLRFLYSLDYEHTNYADTTIYNKTNDYLYTHNLRIMFRYMKPWGYFNGSLYGSNYLNDFLLFSIGGNALTSIRIFRGLSFNIGFGLNMYRNQIALRKGEASPEEMITSQRQMETDYSYNISFGLSFSFGSIFNNSVNPRFGN